jgi:hypothetical protein
MAITTDAKQQIPVPPNLVAQSLRVDGNDRCYDMVRPECKVCGVVMLVRRVVNNICGVRGDAA